MWLEIIVHDRLSVHFGAGKGCSHFVPVQVPAAVEDLIGSAWAQEDILPLNPPAEEAALLREVLFARRVAARARKSKKNAHKSGLPTASPPLSSQPIASAPDSLAIGTSHSTPIDAAVQMVAAHPSKRASIDMQPQDSGVQKRSKLAPRAPSNASKQVWASIFTSGRPAEVETYACRANSARGMSLT